MAFDFSHRTISYPGSYTNVLNMFVVSNISSPEGYEYAPDITNIYSGPTRAPSFLKF